MLADIRGSFEKDGLQWNMPGERKMLHLWKKLIRTEEELRRTSGEVRHLSPTCQKTLLLYSKGPIACMHAILFGYHNLSVRLFFIIPVLSLPPKRRVLISLQLQPAPQSSAIILFFNL